MKRTFTKKPIDSDIDPTAERIRYAQNQLHSSKVRRISYDIDRLLGELDHAILIKRMLTSDDLDTLKLAGGIISELADRLSEIPGFN